MKKIGLIVLLASSLAASAQAVIVGASTGYLVDSEDGIYTARIGHEFKATTGISHIGELETGYAKDNDGPASVKLLPVMLNYRAEFAGSGKLGSYLAVGAGMTRIDAKVFWLAGRDWAFSAQGQAGLKFKVSEATAVTLGARYLWVGDVDMFGSNVRVGDDVSLELGVSFKL